LEGRELSLMILIFTYLSEEEASRSSWKKGIKAENKKKGAIGMCARERELRKRGRTHFSSTGKGD